MVGWASVFYYYGMAGIVWFGFWVVLVSNSPQESRWTSEKEKRAIEASQSTRGSRQVRKK